MTPRRVCRCIGVSIVTILFLTNCLQSKPNSKIASEAAADGHLVIAHGGYNSCGVDVIKPKDQTTGEPNTKVVGEKKSIAPYLGQSANAEENDPQFAANAFKSSLYYYAIKTCDESDKSCRKDVRWSKSSIVESLSPNNPKSNLRWVFSCFAMDRSVHMISSDDPNNQQAVSLEQLWAKVKYMSQLSATTSIIGHSYGGWTAMHSSSFLAKETRLLTLATIDPISMRHCTTNAYLNSAVGCAEFPRDITAAKRSEIIKKSSVWRNYYQVTTTGSFFEKRLHSGRVDAEGITNRLLGRAHTTIDDAPIVWQQHLDDIKKQL